MKYFYDTEFIEDGKTIDLISIGVVAEDGRELYIQNADCRLDLANDWVRENVLPHLAEIEQQEPGGDWFRIDDYGDWSHDALEHVSSRPVILRAPWMWHVGIGLALAAFVGDDKPEFWGYYSAYDHVALCQLFGTMMNLPKSWPFYTRDIKQLCDSLGNPRLPEQGKGEHNALADARWNLTAYRFLERHAAS